MKKSYITPYFILTPQIIFLSVIAITIILSLLVDGFFALHKTIYLLKEESRTEEIQTIANEKYDEVWILGKSEEEIYEKYGRPTGHARKNTQKSKAWVLWDVYYKWDSFFTEDTRWAYVIEFEEGVAVKVEVQCGCKIKAG